MSLSYQPRPPKSTLKEVSMIHWAWLILAFLCGAMCGAVLLHQVLKVGGQVLQAIEEASESLKGRGI